MGQSGSGQHAARGGPGGNNILNQGGALHRACDTIQNGQPYQCQGTLGQGGGGNLLVDLPANATWAPVATFADPLAGYVTPFVTNGDFPNNDLPQSCDPCTTPAKYDVHDCAVSCSKVGACVAFAYCFGCSYGGQPSCWLKSVLTSSFTRPVLTTYVKTYFNNSAINALDNYITPFVSNEDFPGNDMSASCDPCPNNVDVKSCATTCNRHSDCVAFAYCIGCSFAQQPSCWLKSALTAPSRRGLLTTYLKIGAVYTTTPPSLGGGGGGGYVVHFSTLFSRSIGSFN